jgi:hypothetical protein
MCKDPKNKGYLTAIPGGKLKMPFLPTINIGSLAKPAYVPMEV